VDGSVVATHATSGRIQTPVNPLWIGGNLPYGEHFDGLIDEVRVYDRALSPVQISRDMASPVRPAPGLVAGYGFEAGTGTTAVDASGQHNTGRIEGATWTRGRYGRALSFDGMASMVRVGPSARLNLTRAMTLSGWVFPRARQAGWRTVVQRQTDAYFLTASSGRENRRGFVDLVRIVLLVVAVAWFTVLIATRRGPRSAARRRSWWLAIVLFALGSFADAVFAPTGTLIGPSLVAVWLAASASNRVESASLFLAAIVGVAVTTASLADVAGVGVALSRNHAAVTRTAALGAIFVLAGVAAQRGELTLRRRR
jgi:concanavalin A-like lectin/glucanase superfamily protein